MINPNSQTVSGTCFCGAHIPVMFCAMWCDDCMDEWSAEDKTTGISAKDFIARKKLGVPRR